MMYPVSIIPYANMAPFKALGPPYGCTFVMDTPRQSTIALKQRKVLAAPIPVGDLPSVQDEVNFLGPFGIAAAGAVKSVLLFSDRPFEKMAAPARVYLTDQSSSSVRLLYLLLGYQCGFDCLPYLASRKEEGQGHLLIGDEALLFAAENYCHHTTDIAEVWHKVHGLPFVFARWVIVKDAPRECRTALEAWLSEFHAREEELVQISAKLEAKRLAIAPETMLTYLHKMKRVLGPEELEGQRFFLEELSRHERTPLFISPKQRRP